MTESKRSSVIGYDLHDGRLYMKIHNKPGEDKNAPLHIIGVTSPYIGDPEMVLMQPGEQRYMLPVGGGRITRISCDEEHGYSLEELAMPGRYRITPPDAARAALLRPTLKTSSKSIGKPADQSDNTIEQSSANDATQSAGYTLGPLDEDKLKEALTELDSLTGLDSVKQGIRKKIAYAERMRELVELGEAQEEQISLHLVLTGNPGTGKTTVARIYGKVLQALGLLKSGHLVESKEDDLIGGYVGQSAIKTNKKCDEAMDGILYIDEAHHLLPPEGVGGDFKRQSLGVLTKRMEDDRHRFVVVLSGYGDTPDAPGIDTLVAKTPGFPSRFKSFIHHEDFKPDDLKVIFNGMVKKQGLILGPGAAEAGYDAIARRQQETGKGFENGREVRNIIENALEQISLRVCPPDQPRQPISQMTLSERMARRDALKTLMPGDFNAMADSFKPKVEAKRQSIGFLADLPAQLPAAAAAASKPVPVLSAGRHLN